jgi:hypothetical protein
MSCALPVVQRGRRLGADQGKRLADLGILGHLTCLRVGAAVGVIDADRLLRAVACGQRDRYQATVRCTASRCGVGSRWPKAASNLLASMTKGARNW